MINNHLVQRELQSLMKKILCVMPLIAFSAFTTSDSVPIESAVDGEAVVNEKQQTVLHHEIGQIDYSDVKFSSGTDEYEPGLENANWGGPELIATWQGHKITAGYDHDYCEHIIMVDGKFHLAFGDLHISNIDRNKNVVTFERGIDKTTVNFNKPNALVDLERLQKPSPGWHSEKFTFASLNGYCDTIITEYCRHNIKLTMPVEQEKRKVLLNFLAGKRMDLSGVRDTTHIVRKDLHSVRDLVETLSEYEYFSSWLDYVKPIDPSERPDLWKRINTFEAFPVYQSEKYVTLALCDNDIYHVGGGSSSQKIYNTVNIETGKEITWRDIFKPESLKHIKSIYFEAVGKDVTAAGIYGEFDADRNESMPLTSAEIENMLMEEIHGEADEETLLNKYPIAITENDIIFTYPFSVFSGFGESTMTCLKVPVEKVRKYMNPGGH